jgi:type I restriction enzyme M protein
MLSGDGVSARVKEELLKSFNLHLVVRLPNGVFSPYTPIPSNLLFFDRSKETKEVWFYEHPLPEERKTYTKTKPLMYEEFLPCLEWLSAPKRKENDLAWKVAVSEIEKNGFNLDIANPKKVERIDSRNPSEIATALRISEEKILSLISDIETKLHEVGI